MKRSWVWVVMLVGALVVVVPRASAQRPPDKDPQGDDQTIVMSFDRSSPPGDITLWPDRTMLAYEAAGTRGYGSLFLTCISSTDSERGRCPTEDSHEIAPNRKTNISLRFVERRSGMRRDINVEAFIRRADATPACSFDYWESYIRPISSSFGEFCTSDAPAGTGAGITVPASELALLTAGHWDATLHLDLRLPPAQHLLSYTFTFDLTITDHNNVAIYFPLFDFSAPLVDLNLQYNPISRPPSIGGSTVLDMCLYDGLGSQSEFLGVTVRNRDPRPPGPSGFSVWHQDGANTDRDRVDLNISLDHDGRKVRMANGVEQELRGIDTAKLRLVVLPGMTQPVFCVPTPLTLETPSFDASSKRNGTYEGELQVELRLPTSRP
ncbi:CfaE/CblD family pilus tip adhesin [Stenotrophomonas sp. C2852]|uniref:CfaE/CblD family pilus tip adhesin n=1 Tax=Stenotrophomonas sp. C2852 TaxID=3077845 RepID=UPI00293CBDB7|nr:CfaE/CblD family pilus tip adhesin [Stenotrophomonas sp. C2852]MDV3436315.1 CfaE/CblD family pilus tip adhesin [Stenotrophomonas sp. C2852]